MSSNLDRVELRDLGQLAVGCEASAVVAWVLNNNYLPLLIQVTIASWKSTEACCGWSFCGWSRFRGSTVNSFIKYSSSQLCTHETNLIRFCFLKHFMVQQWFKNEKRTTFNISLNVSGLHFESSIWCFIALKKFNVLLIENLENKIILNEWKK